MGVTLAGKIRLRSSSYSTYRPKPKNHRGGAETRKKAQAKNLPFSPVFSAPPRLCGENDLTEGYGLYADHRARRFPDNGVRVGAQAAEHAGGRAAADHQHIGVETFCGGADQAGGFAGFDVQFGGRGAHLAAQAVQGVSGRRSKLRIAGRDVEQGEARVDLPREVRRAAI